MADAAPTGLILYFADPMCSWCYGFTPILRDLIATYTGKLEIRPVMGGLRPGTKTPMSNDDKSALRGHWNHVIEASGQPFDFTLFERDDFIYDTEPACRAVIVMREIRNDLALVYMAAIQKAFYADGRDPTDPTVLSQIANDVGVEAQSFTRALASGPAFQMTQREFKFASEAGVRGFPTLLIGDHERGYALLSNGYTKFEPLKTAIDQWLLTPHSAD